MKENNSEANFVCHLIRTERMHKSIVDSRISALGIHRNQYSVLREIGNVEKTPGATPLSQKDLAEKFGISAAAIAMMLKKMEAEGYIKRVMSMADNRYNELYLDDHGREILDRTGAIFHELKTVMYQGLSDEEVEVMSRCLVKIQENLSSLPECQDETFAQNNFKKRD